MNGYQVMSDAYKKAAEEGKIPNEVAEKQCRIYDFLATCDEKDFDILFDSMAFVKYANAYLNATLKGLQEKGTINDIQTLCIKSDFAVMLSEKKSKDVLQ